MITQDDVLSPSAKSSFQNGDRPPSKPNSLPTTGPYPTGQSTYHHNDKYKKRESCCSGKNDFCPFWRRWVWVIPRYALYRCTKNGFYTVFGSSRNNSFSLAGLLLGITLGMFVGFFLQGCGRDLAPDASWESRFDLDPYDIAMPPGGKYRYHSAQQDAGYEPRVISAVASKGDAFKMAAVGGGQPPKVIPPAGSVKVVRPYHLATELGIVHKVALAFIPAEVDGDADWQAQNEAAANGTSSSSKEAQLVRLLRQLTALEDALERQFLTPDPDALGHEGDGVNAFASSFQFERGASFMFDGQSVVGGSRSDAPTSARVVGKVLYFVRADANELATLLPRYFPRLAPLGPKPGDATNADAPDRDVAALDADDAPSVDEDVIDAEAIFARVKRLRRDANTPPQQGSARKATPDFSALLAPYVQIVALEANTPAQFVGAILKFAVDREVYDHENIWFGRASGAHMRLERFARFVAGLRRGQPVYIGHPYEAPSSSSGDGGNVKKRELSGSENYCDLDAGFLLGQSEVLTVKTNLATCLDDRSLFEGVGLSQQVQHIMGTCVSQILQQNCDSFSNEVEYVASDYKTAQIILSSGSTSGSAGSPLAERFNRSLIVYGLPQSSRPGGISEDELSVFNARLESYFIDADLRQVEVEIDKVRSELARLQPHIPDAKDEVFFTYGVRPRTKPRNHFDVNPWVYFNTTHSLLPTELDTVAELNERELAEVSEVVDFAKTQFHHKYPDYVFDKLVNGYKQHDLTRGIEYILDMEFVEKSTRTNPITRRCHVMRPTGIPKIVYLNNDPLDLKSITSSDGQTLTPTIIRYIIVGVSYRDTEQALEFLTHYTSKSSITGFSNMHDVRLLVVFLVLEPVNASRPEAEVKAQTFLEAQNKALDPVKRRVAAIKKSKLVRNLGWFTLGLPAKQVEQDGPVTFVHDGSTSVKIVTAFAEKIVAKYGDDRYVANKNPNPNVKGTDKRYINFVTLVPINARLSASDFLVRAMGNTRRGYKVSFAVPFQRYDPDIAKPSYEGKPSNYKPDIHDIRTSVGRYDKDNWGIASFYLSDFMTAIEKFYNASNPTSPQPPSANTLANALHYPASLDVAELFLADDKLEIFRYVEPFAVLEHSSTDLDCIPSPDCNDVNDKTRCPVVGHRFAMNQRECLLRKYSNAGTNTQLAFRVFENQLGINMSQYETIMANKNKVKKFIGK